MKRIFLIIVVLFAAFFSNAKQDEKAKEILDKVSENTRSYKSISAAFTFTMQNREMDINEKNEGILIYLRSIQLLFIYMSTTYSKLHYVTKL